MTTIMAAFILAFVLGLLLTYICIPLSVRFGIVDRPDTFRRLHKVATPKLGGLAIFLSFLAPIVMLMLFPEWSLVSQALMPSIGKLCSLIVCAEMVLVLGLADDMIDLSAGKKILLQIGIASVAYVMGFRIETISVPFVSSVNLGLLAFPVTVFWFVAFMNAVNLLDGMDGLSAGVCLFAGVTLFAMSMITGNIIGMFLMACLVGSVSGFLMFNFPPARIFLGNSGSLLLGFLVAALSLIGATRKAETAVALFVPIVVLGLPIIDTFLAVLRRWYHKLPLSTPDRGHIHHLLGSMGYSPRRAVLILYLFCVVLGVSAFLIMIGRSEVVFLVVLMLAVMVYACVRIFAKMKFVDVLDKVAEDIARKDHRKKAQKSVQIAITRIENEDDISKIWSIYTEAFEGLGIDRAELMLNAEMDIDIENLVWQREEGQVERGDCSTVRLELVQKEQKIGCLQLCGCSPNIRKALMPGIADMIDYLRNELEIKIGNKIKK